MSLYEKDQTVLGADIVVRDEFVIQPGEIKTIKRLLAADTKSIGVLAAFREIEKARWRAVVAVIPNKDNLVTISNGSADGVKKDMVFVVSRNDQYVGDLKISHTEPNRAAGRMIKSTVAPMTGDRVVDVLGAQSPR